MSKPLTLVKVLAEYIGSISKITGAAATLVTILCWYSVSVGSWHNTSNGCIEFDVRPTVEGLLYSPDPAVITKYENGFTIINWVSIRFFTERRGQRTEGGIATGWVNPFTGTLSLRYKLQEIGGKLADGYRAKQPIVFERKANECSKSET